MIQPEGHLLNGEAAALLLGRGLDVVRLQPACSFSAVEVEHQDQPIINLTVAAHAVGRNILTASTLALLDCHNNEGDPTDTRWLLRNADKSSIQLKNGTVVNIHQSTISEERGPEVRNPQLLPVTETTVRAISNAQDILAGLAMHATRVKVRLNEYPNGRYQEAVGTQVKGWLISPDDRIAFENSLYPLVRVIFSDSLPMHADPAQQRHLYSTSARDASAHMIFTMIDATRHDSKDTDAHIGLQK